MRLLTPRPEFRFHEVDVGGLRVVLLEVHRAIRHPVRFQNESYIRLGSVTKKLKDLPEKERSLWLTLDQAPFEQGVAAAGVTVADVLRLIDYPAYFELLSLPVPDGHAATVDALRADGLVAPSGAGTWNITNLGAVLFAKDLRVFPGLARKAMRVIRYKGKGRIGTEREHLEIRGYAAAFKGVIEHVMALLPAREAIPEAHRVELTAFPREAIRELVGNALIHQDFAVRGAGPMLEIFDGRVEVTNPGEPLVATDRFIDTPPTSRNEALASFMRRVEVCEERGSGFDKVVSATEVHHLPAPLIEVPPGFTRVVLYDRRPLSDMDRVERERACYMHACLRFVQRDFLTNASLRERLGLDAKNGATASRLIRDALKEGLIVPFDTEAFRPQMKYMPWWGRHLRRDLG